MNKKQRITLSVAVTLILFVIAFSWSTSIRRSFSLNKFKTDRYGYIVEGREIKFEEIDLSGKEILGKKILGRKILGEEIEFEVEYLDGEVFGLRYNWYVWTLFIIISGGFNYWLFVDKRKHSKNNMKIITHSIPENMSSDLLSSIKQLQSEIGDLPEELKQFEGLINRQLGWFDPNRFLEVFPTIKLRPNYTLNYFYTKNEQSGRPILYTRKDNKNPLTYKEMDNMLHHMKQTSELIKHLEFERSILGFFHFAIFNIIVHQFYLTGKSINFDSDFIFTKRFLYKTIKRMNVGRSLLHPYIITKPQIKMLNDYIAEVTLTMFSESSGIFNEKIRIEWSCKILATESEIVVEPKLEEKI